MFSDNSIEGRAQIGRGALTLLTLTLMLLLPELAFAQAGGGAPWAGPLQTIEGWLTGDAATSLAVIAVAGLGLATMIGRMSWGWAGSIIGGIVIVFGSAWIVSTLQGSV